MKIYLPLRWSFWLAVQHQMINPRLYVHTGNTEVTQWVGNMFNNLYEYITTVVNKEAVILREREG